MAGFGASWAERTNWSNGVPGQFDKAVFDITNIRPGRIADVQTIKEITINELTLSANFKDHFLQLGRTLTVRAAFTQAGGNIRGADLELLGASSWSGGSMGDPAVPLGTTYIGGSMKIDSAGGGAYARARAITNLNSVKWLSGELNLQSGSVFRNAPGSTFVVQGGTVVGGDEKTSSFVVDARIAGVESARFEVSAASASLPVMRVPFISKGTVIVYGRGLMLFKTSDLSGTLSVDTGKRIYFIGPSHVWNDNLIIMGSGILQEMAGATIIIRGNVRLGFLSYPTFKQNGDVTGTGILTVQAATYNWENGKIMGKGTINLSPATWQTGFPPPTMNISTAGVLDQWTINNSGVINLLAGNAGTTLQVTNGASITNLGVFDLQDDWNIKGDRTTKFLNVGVFQKTGGNGNSDVKINFVSGQLLPAPIPVPILIWRKSGRITFSGPVARMNAGAALPGGGVIGVSGIAFDMEGGVLSGTTTLAGEVLNNWGDVEPGGKGTIGTLTIGGRYTQNYGSLGIDVAGSPSSGKFDQLAITGVASLGGTLTVDMTNYTPTAGDQFKIVTFASSLGYQFQSFGVVGLASHYMVYLTYNSQDVTLNVIALEASPPTVTGVSPNSGPTGGGTLVTITGTNLLTIGSVTFGGVASSQIIPVSSTQIKAYSPPHTAGTIDIVVTNTQNTPSATSSADHFTYAASPAPSVTGVSPNSGLTTGGTSVGITGSNLTGASAVSFGNTAAVSFTVNSDTSITATSPGGVAGVVDIRVTTPTGTSNTSSSDQFTYTAVVAPTVTAVSPSSGSTGGGSTVTITGTNLTGTGWVYFGNLPAAAFMVNSATQITATSPAHAAGTIDVTVTTAGGISRTNSADRFSYTNPLAPTVTGLLITSGPSSGGTAVRISGTNFQLGASSVSFGGTSSLSVTVNSATLITAVSPAHVAGTVDVIVTTFNGSSVVSAADRFTYVSVAAPTVTGVSPNSGSTAGGTNVTITGTNLGATSSVMFGSAPAKSFTIYSSANIVAVSPGEAAGTIDITVSTPNGTSAISGSDHYTFAAAAGPAVTSITPSSGPTAGGTFVIIIGNNFLDATGVSFGGSVALSFNVVSANEVTATSPGGAAGVVDITVTTPSGTSSVVSADQFTYTTVGPPVITTLTPTSGPSSGGTIVTISGSNFTGATAVQFGGINASAFTVNSDSQIVATSPPKFVGTIDVTVTTPNGTSAYSAGDRYTYTSSAVPTITSISPSSGPATGGTVVSIYGSNYVGVSLVYFGAVASSFTVNSSGWITATSPPHQAGVVHITVASAVGTSSLSSADQFTYTSGIGPTITGIAPTSGTAGGGSLVTITGSGFNGASSVAFGAVAASSFQIYSDLAMVAVAPAQSAGTVDITVTTPNGTSSTSSADQFTYTGAGLPSVGSVTPNSGSTAGGSLVAITGSAFSGATAVLFGSIAASSFTVFPDTTIIAISPPEAAGTVDIRVTTYSGTSSIVAADHYTFTNVTGSAPTVTAVDPNSGSTTGGRVVTITGTNFAGTAAVSFGGTAATAFTVNSATQITATAPAKSAATYDITVTTNNGTSSTGAADQFTYLSTPAPAVTSISPTTGTTAGGASVTITGSNFTSASAVSFGYFAATTYTVNSVTQITAIAPPQAASTVDITVTTPSGISATGSGDQFTYTAAALPAITSLSPTSGSTAGGTSVTITGSGFTGTTGVSFDAAAAATFTVNSDTAITATTPPYWAGTFNVTVTTFSGTSALVNGDRFTFTLAATAAVTSISPNTGSTAGGTSVTLTGTNFTGASSVYFGTVAAASFTFTSDTQITATSPPQAAGVIPITVTTPSGTSAAGSGNQFTYTVASAPTVSSISPNSGTTAGGTSVTLTGTNFTGATGVSFGTVAASFSVTSATQITAIAPSQAAATVHITVTTYAGTSGTSANDQFTYTAAAAPAVTGITPTSGSTAGGALVTILGSGFTGASAVKFGTTAATAFTVYSNTTILANAPPLAAGAWDITVTTPSGTSPTSSADQFTASTPAVPTVTSLGTTSGGTAGGTVLTITGSGFTGASAVQFGTVWASTFTVNSDTLITVIAPPAAAGNIDITVIASGGTSAPASGDQFSFSQISTPAVTSLDTTAGSTAGGTVLTVTGTNFTAATSVLFGTTAAASYTVLSDTQILATSPALPAGTVDITVTTPTGTSASGSPDQFTYAAATAPAITNIAPTSGTSAGGAVITITGSNFTGATAVNFGTTAAAAFAVNSDMQITATAPPVAAGTVHVTVVTNAGTSATGSGDQFTTTAATVPSVTGIVPTSGSAAGGTIVTVSGSNFTGATAVAFGSTAVNWFTINSDGSLTTISPAGTAGTVDVKVTTLSGTSSTSASDQFTYSSVSAPTVTAVSPTSGTTAGGTVVTISGTGFTGATNVTFGNYSSPLFAINSDTQITALAPAEPAATVDIQVTSYGGSSATGSADQFTYSAASAPTVTSLTTNNGPLAGGTIITITGTNFTGATGVSFGTVAATSFSVYSDTAIVATSPAESAGTVDITVTTYSATSATSSADQFSYLTVPTVTSINPNTGPTSGGTSVTITGTSFLGTTSVLFGTLSASFTINSNTSITATSPAQSGQLDITVTNAYGTSTTSIHDQFTYYGGGGGRPSPERTFAVAADVPADSAPLTMPQLEPVIQEAIGEWQAAGADAGQLQALESSQFEIADMPPTYLGWTYAPVAGSQPQPGLVVMDRMAQGFGWYIDSSLAGNTAFAIKIAPGEFRATTDSPALRHMDLLTVVAHELGHIVGLPDISASAYPGLIMDGTLNPGVRRIPTNEFQVTNVPVLEKAAATASSTAVNRLRAPSTDILFEQWWQGGSVLADRSPREGLTAPATPPDYLRETPARLPTTDDALQALLAARAEVRFLDGVAARRTAAPNEWLFTMAELRPSSDQWADQLSRASAPVP